MNVCAGAIACVAVVVPAAHAANPDLSLIGDVRASFVEDADEPALDLHEVEIAITGPVNPYATAAVYIGVHDGTEFEIEEAKLMLDRYLPGRLGLTVGRYLLDFGQLNETHAHAYPFLDRPLMHETLFGPDGVLDVGARLDWIAPVEAVTLRAAAGVVGGESAAGGHDHEEGATHDHDIDEEEDPPLAFTGRLDLFSEPSDAVSFRAGGSMLVDREGESRFFSPDLRLRVETGPRSVLVVNAEAVFGKLEVHDEDEHAHGEEGHSVSPNGVFVSADYRMGAHWNGGGFFESTTAREHDDHRTDRFGAFVGFSLMEESTLFRLLVRQTEPDEDESSFDITLQALFGLGPHAPHRY
jgi:hypothetical protein